MKKIAIIGSRNITSVAIGDVIRQFFGMDFNDIEIISGGAKGVDTLAENFAKSNGIKVDVFKPNYSLHGRGATFVRNRAMVDACDYVLAIWDGKSHGTQYTINYAKNKGKVVHISYC